MKRAKLDPEAEAELREAAVWYRERSAEVARRFIREVRALTREIARKPLRFPVLLQPDLGIPVRRALVPGFPYAIVFLVVSDTIFVLAVAHQHRLPGYWIHRIRDGE